MRRPCARRNWDRVRLSASAEGAAGRSDVRPSLSPMFFIGVSPLHASVEVARREIAYLNYMICRYILMSQYDYKSNKRRLSIDCDLFILILGDAALFVLRLYSSALTRQCDRGEPAFPQGRSSALGHAFAQGRSSEPVGPPSRRGDPRHSGPSETGSLESGTWQRSTKTFSVWLFPHSEP